MQLRLFLVGLALTLSLSSCSLFYSTRQIIVYHVKSGDTVSEIADKFNLSPQTIMKLNRIRDPRRLSVGQRLEIPYLKSGKPKAPETSYRVVSRKFNLAGRQAPPGKGGLSWPVDPAKMRLSSKFGWRRFKQHEGVDLAAPTGTPIYAAHSGVVMVSGFQLKGYGRMLILQNGNMLTLYAHNSKNYVKRGQSVRQGQRIAEIGTTGNSTGPHLHFEVRLRKPGGRFKAVDPLRYLK